MADFCDIAMVEELLRVSISTGDQVVACQRAITAASEAIRNYCNQTIHLVEDDEYTFDVPAGQYNLILPELPVVSVESVVEDDETLTVTDDYILANHGQLIRVGARWKQGWQIVTVTYTHGYATIPDDIADMATRIAARVYQAGLRAADMDGVPGVAAKSLGDYSVQYTTEGSEGVMGVSAARALLMSEKDLLNRYRIRGL